MRALDVSLFQHHNFKPWSFKLGGCYPPAIHHNYLPKSPATSASHSMDRTSEIQDEVILMAENSIQKSHLLEVLLGFPRFCFGCLAKATSAKAGRFEKPRQPRPIGMIFRELFVPTWMMCWLVAMQQCILSPTECWSAASTLAKHARWCCSASRTRSAFHLKVSCQKDLHLPYRLDSTLPWRFP